MAGGAWEPGPVAAGAGDSAGTGPTGRGRTGRERLCPRWEETEPGTPPGRPEREGAARTQAQRQKGWGQREVRAQLWTDGRTDAGLARGRRDFSCRSHHTCGTDLSAREGAGGEGCAQEGTPSPTPTPPYPYPKPLTHPHLPPHPHSHPHTPTPTPPQARPPVRGAGGSRALRDKGVQPAGPLPRLMVGAPQPDSRTKAFWVLGLGDCRPVSVCGPGAGEGRARGGEGRAQGGRGVWGVPAAALTSPSRVEPPLFTHGVRLAAAASFFASCLGIGEERGPEGPAGGLGAPALPRPAGPLSLCPPTPPTGLCPAPPPTPGNPLHAWAPPPPLIPPPPPCGQGPGRGRTGGSGSPDS